MPPKIDPRDFDTILRAMRAKIPLYTSEWQPSDTDAGLTLVNLFAAMVATIGQRLNKTPAKHLAAFLETLGITLLPAQSARAPVTFLLAEGVKTPVLIPARTQVATGEVFFETEKNILATPARLVKMYSVDEKGDQIYEHQTLVGSDFKFFAGKEQQEHCVYLGHNEVLNVKSEMTLQLNISPWNDSIANSQLVQWEYWGEREENKTKTLDWYSFTISTSGSILALEKKNADELKECEINGIKSRWIRCKVEPSQITHVQSVIETIGLAIVPEAATGIPPDMAFYNDVPLDLTLKDDDKSFKNSIYPFGETPRMFDTFYSMIQFLK
jgi:hypothetical protein